MSTQCVADAYFVYDLSLTRNGIRGEWFQSSNCRGLIRQSNSYTGSTRQIRTILPSTVVQLQRHAITPIPQQTD